MSRLPAPAGHSIAWRASARHSSPRHAPARDTPAWLIASLGVGAVALLISAARRFREAGTTIAPFADKARLSTPGPYRVPRNPLCLAMDLALTAWVRWLASPPSRRLPPLSVRVLTARQIRPKEHRLNRLNRLSGVEFAAYCRQPRRWL